MLFPDLQLRDSKRKKQGQWRIHLGGGGRNSSDNSGPNRGIQGSLNLSPAFLERCHEPPQIFLFNLLPLQSSRVFGLFVQREEVWEMIWEVVPSRCTSLMYLWPMPLLDTSLLIRFLQHCSPSCLLYNYHQFYEGHAVPSYTAHKKEG